MLKVSKINVIDEFRPAGRPPFVDHLFPAQPAVLARRWALSRLVAAGGAATARVTILDGSVKAEDLSRDLGIEGAFKLEQEVLYAGRLEVMVEIVDPDGVAVAVARAEVDRHQTLPEGTTLNQRDRMFFDMADQLVTDLDQELSARMSEYLAGFL